jgi:hypothetical protein
MSGPRRLAVFFGLFWIVFWFAAYYADSPFEVMPFFVIGVAPVALSFGTWWVIQGFRKGEPK